MRLNNRAASAAHALFHALLLATLAGCASSPPAPPLDLSPTPVLGALRAPPKGECPVWVYRNNTYFHALNPEQPYVYVNDLKVDTLSIGETYCLNLAPGKYQVSVKEPLLFMPVFDAGSLIIDVKEGTTQYVRYSKEFGSLIPTPLGVTVTSDKKLELVAKSAWVGRL